MKTFGIIISIVLLAVTSQLMDKFANIGNESTDMAVRNIAFTINIVLFSAMLLSVAIINRFTGAIKWVTNKLDKLDSSL